MQLGSFHAFDFDLDLFFFGPQADQPAVTFLEGAAIAMIAHQPRQEQTPQGDGSQDSEQAWWVGTE